MDWRMQSPKLTPEQFLQIVQIEFDIRGSVGKTYTLSIVDVDPSESICHDAQPLSTLWKTLRENLGILPYKMQLEQESCASCTDAVANTNSQRLVCSNNRMLES